MLRRAVKALDEGFINETTALETRATAQDILNRVKIAEDAAIETQRQDPDISDPMLSDTGAQRAARGAITPKPIQQADTKFDVKRGSLPPLPKRIDFTQKSPEVVRQFMQELREVLHDKTSYRIEHLFQFIDQIPIPQFDPKRSGTLKVQKMDGGVFEACSEQQLREIQEGLSELLKIYAENKTSVEEERDELELEFEGPILSETDRFIKESKKATDRVIKESKKASERLEKVLRGETIEDKSAVRVSRNFATVLPLYVLMHYLALKIDEHKLGVKASDAHLESYPIPSFADGLEVERLQWLDRKEFDRANAASNYLNTFNSLSFSSDDLLFELARKEVAGRGIEMELGADIVSGKIEKMPATTRYWQALLDSDPTLKQAISNVAEQNDNLRDWTKEEIEADLERQKRDWVNGEKNPILNWIKLDEPTKLMIVMEGVDNPPHNRPFKRLGYDHIDLFRKTMYLARQGMYRGYGLDASHRSKTKYYNLMSTLRPSVYEAKGAANYDVYTAIYVKGKRNPDQVISKQIENEHLTCLGVAFGEIYHEALRNREKWEQDTAEGRDLLLKSTASFEKFRDINILFLEKMLRTLSQWELTPTQLLYLIESEPEQLKDPELQELLLELFFRSPVLKPDTGAVELGAGDLILHNQALLDQAAKVIKEGLAVQFHLEDGLEIGRFYLALGYQLQKYLIDGGQPEKAKALDLIPTIDQWLVRQKGQLNDLPILYFYRTLFLSLQTVKSPREYAELFSSSLTYSMVSGQNSTWKSPFLQEQLRKATSYAAAKLAADPQTPTFIDQLGTQIFDKLKQYTKNPVFDEPFKGEEWKVHKQGMPYILKKPWLFNLETGEVYNNGFPISQIHHHHWTSDYEFIRLFGHQSQLGYMRTALDVFTFSDPDKGQFRFRYSREISARANNSIQKLIQPWGWFSLKSYNNEGSGLKNEFPIHLLKDHAVWIAENPFEVDGKLMNAVITDRHQQKLEYFITKNEGKIIEADAETQKVKTGGLCIDMIDESSGLTRFDKADVIVTERSDADQRVRQVKFERYLSFDGNPLVFRANSEGKYVWSENQDYYIPEKMQNHFFGTMKNYLHLQSRDKDKSILLVPFQLIKDDGSLDIAHAKEQAIGSRDDIVFGKERYFVFDLIKGEITGRSSESKLFLSYLYASQHNYQGAIQILKSLGDVKKRSALDIEVLELIWRQLPLQEDHPDAKMVRMHALSQWIKAQQRNVNEPVKEYFQNITDVTSLMENMTDALQSAGNISKGCRLSIKQERIILDLLLKEFKRCLEKIGNPEKRIKILSENQHVLDTLTYRLKSLSGEEGATETSLRFIKEGEPDLLKDSSRSTAQTFNFRGNLAEIAKVKDKIKNAHNYSNLYTESEMFYIQPPTMDKIESDAFFWNIYALAHSEEPDAAMKRSEMIYRLEKWKKFWVYEVPPVALDQLIFILKHPRVFPKKSLTIGSLQNTLFKARIMSIIGTISIVKILFGWIFSLGSGLLYLKRLASRSISRAWNNAGAVKATHVAYPILLKSPLKIAPPSKLTGEKIPLAHTENTHWKALDAKSKRWEDLSDWKRDFIIETDSEIKQAPLDLTIKAGDADYEKSLANDLQLLSDDYAAGQAENKQIKIPEISDDNRSRLQAEAEAKLKDTQNEKRELENELELKINKLSDDPKTAELELSRLGGKAAQHMSFQDCVDCLLANDRRLYKQKNPHLTDDDIDEIVALTLKVLDLKSYEGQLQSIVELATKLGRPENTSSVRAELLQNLDLKLRGRYHFDDFDPQIQLIFRVFAGQSGILPFKNQIELIKEMMKPGADPKRIQDIIVQLIMGGGKTSVIATILLYMFANSGNGLSCFIVPPSLMDVVKFNLADSMRQAFGKELIVVQMDREDFTRVRLKQTVELLQEAVEDHRPTMISASTLQGLQLEM